MASGEKQESGAQTLPAAAQEIGGDFGDRRKGGLALPCEFLLDQNEVLAFQAAIAAVHAAAATADATDWSQIIALYDQLYALRPHPVVALNRSVAIAELHGPAEGLAALAQTDTATLGKYQPYHAARAGLLARAGRRDEALVITVEDDGPGLKDEVAHPYGVGFKNSAERLTALYGDDAHMSVGARPYGPGFVVVVFLPFRKAPRMPANAARVAVEV